GRFPLNLIPGHWRYGPIVYANRANAATSDPAPNRNRLRRWIVPAVRIAHKLRVDWFRDKRPLARRPKQAFHFATSPRTGDISHPIESASQNGPNGSVVETFDPLRLHQRSKPR